MSSPARCGLVAVALTLAAALAPAAEQPVIRRENLHLRDVFVWPDPATKTYYLYGCAGPVVPLYTSTDLEHWQGPEIVCRVPPKFWAEGDIWAPEMQVYQGKFYMFATYSSTKLWPEQWKNWRPRLTRATQVFVADSPRGPFRPITPEPTLPQDMMTLDGTLWIEDGKPWIVYAHEWVQIKVGTIEAMALSPDLAKAQGGPVVMIQASDAPWSRHADDGSQVTDGPFMHRLPNGKLLMLWSSFSPDGYAVGQAISDSGKLAGPWRHIAKALFSGDGGHPMLFRRFDGQLMLALHYKNRATLERPKFLPVLETAEGLELLQPKPLSHPIA